MGKPTEQELKQALEYAQQMREQDRDPEHLAKALLSCHYENSLLEAVLQAAETYVKSGLAEQEHRRLVKAIEKARSALGRGGASKPETFGL